MKTNPHTGAKLAHEIKLTKLPHSVARQAQAGAPMYAKSEGKDGITLTAWFEDEDAAAAWKASYEVKAEPKKAKVEEPVADEGDENEKGAE